MAIEIIDGQEYKRCSKCETVKPISEFYKDNTKTDGYRSYCKECKKIHGKQYRFLNHDKIRETERLYKINNREKVNEYTKLYCEKKRKETIIRQAERAKYYEEHKEEIEKEKEIKKAIRRKKEKEYNKKRHKKFYNNNKLKLRQKAKDYYAKNRDKEIKRIAKYKENNQVFVLGQWLYKNTAPAVSKEAIEGLIELRNKTKFIEEIKNGY